MNNFFYGLKKVHFIGVGGVSMSKLCAYTLGIGIQCTGSDAKNSGTIDKLRAMVKSVILHWKQIWLFIQVQSNLIILNCLQQKSVWNAKNILH